ncbi:MAG TPA: thiamine phosphate synthase [Candidatus Dormibacteraeota bacterium]
MLEAARLYAITPDAEPDAVVSLVGAVLRGGADVVQLRHKALARGVLLDLAGRLAALVHEAGRLFIVNDHLDIALLAEADGVHLGADDLPLEAARRVAGPRFLIGASANTPVLAREAVAAGADYLGAGPAFATSIKLGKAVIGPEGVAAVAAAVEVPVFAIGGIEAGNLGLLLAAGVHRACVIRGLAEAADPEAAARRLRAVLAA